jgi:hypothetical protein
MLKNFKGDIDDKFLKLNEQLVDLNNRIKVLELGAGLARRQSPFNRNFNQQQGNSNKPKTQDMQYIATHQELENYKKSEIVSNTEQPSGPIPSANTTTISNNQQKSNTDNTNDKGKSRAEKRPRAYSPPINEEASTSVPFPPKKFNKIHNYNDELETVMTQQKNFEKELSGLRGYMDEKMTQIMNVLSGNRNNTTPHSQ